MNFRPAENRTFRLHACTIKILILFYSSAYTISRSGRFNLEASLLWNELCYKRIVMSSLNKFDMTLQRLFQKDLR